MKNTDSIFSDMHKRDLLLNAVLFCGNYALNKQEHIARSYKSDGSVLTDTDLYIHNYITRVLKELYPSCGIISEECGDLPEGKKDYIFVLDPVDGTDAYSQGMPTWCVALGILDSRLDPAGGIVYAPRWGIGNPEGLFLIRFPGEEVTNLGEPMGLKHFRLPPKQIVTCSTTLKFLDLGTFSGKIRSFGSNIIHVLSPAVHSHIDITIFSPCFIWDIAAAHGIIDALGLEIRYLDGSSIDYSQLVNREPSRDFALAGTLEATDYMRKLLFRRKGRT